ncbi:GIY-YIG nuclease family protein, partial [Enterobacter cloacae complex sp. 4DZ1-17B1]|uniref:GIY-YIG nuclease family protein n=1 Tax=Enterobacter cloacae complex sp. 4DZ1-17B1 TaxID=2511991 RepID=UPI0013E9ACE7
LESLFKTKIDDIDILKKSNIIYKINCSECTATYVGQTKRYLKKRIYEHTNNWKREIGHIALTSHMLNTGHSFKFAEVEILETEPHWKKRNIKEMIHIKKQKSSINFRTDTEKLINSYNILINDL